MNETLKEIRKDLKALLTTLLKMEREDSGFGSDLGDHSYEQGMMDAIETVESYMEEQSREDIRQGRGKI